VRYYQEPSPDLDDSDQYIRGEVYSDDDLIEFDSGVSDGEEDTPGPNSGISSDRLYFTDEFDSSSSLPREQYYLARSAEELSYEQDLDNTDYIMARRPRPLTSHYEAAVSKLERSRRRGEADVTLTHDEIKALRRRSQPSADSRTIVAGRRVSLIENRRDIDLDSPRDSERNQSRHRRRRPVAESSHSNSPQRDQARKSAWSRRRTTDGASNLLSATLNPSRNHAVVSTRLRRLPEPEEHSPSTPPSEDQPRSTPRYRPELVVVRGPVGAPVYMPVDEFAGGSAGRRVVSDPQFMRSSPEMVRRRSARLRPSARRGSDDGS